MQHTFYAKRILQWEGALPFYVIDTTPSELLQWSSVPRKAPEAMEGYQRPLTDRYKKISDFMESHKSNFIPGSVIVASDKRAGEFFAVNPVEIKGVDPSSHQVYEVSFEYEPKTHKEMLEEIIQSLLNDREWTDAENASMNVANEAALAAEAEHPSKSDDREATDNASEDSAPPLESRMAGFVLRLEHLRDNWDAEIESKPADDPERQQWMSWIEDNHKVGFIMDGQHRVWGAEHVNPDECDHLAADAEPVLPVTLIPDMTRAEQVFHFAMMNITPEKVKAGQARSNASFSLTVKEFGDYQPRLDRFVDTTDAIWINRIDGDPSSPFQGKLTYDYLGREAEKRCVQEKVIVQIAQQWRRKDQKDKSIGDLYEGASVWANDTNDFKLASFFRFWKEVKTRFPIDWENPESNIWKKVSLWVLQDFVRQHMANQVELWKENNAHPMEDLESLGKFVEFVLKKFPQDFFLHAWNHVDDTSDGRRELMGYMTDQYKLPKVDKRKTLYKGA